MARTTIQPACRSRARSLAPDIWARLQTSYRKVAEFPGTVGGGDVVVMVRG